ncbi:MAG: 4-hydroxythreonine-4-phosphate dehydrogenase [Epsilonproteobacteria bacterium]|nr:4-hydroxythreonine-4-phosphate dehydrogenase [Campylobacterota bacterium]
MLPKIAISIGDLNGVGIEIAFKAHEEISQYCKPIYCINETMLSQAAQLLHVNIPHDFNIYPTQGEFEIKKGSVTKESGLYSYHSFLDAINLAKEKKVDAITTLPIHKEAWAKAEINYKGHTDMLRDIFQKDAIMMLGCPKMFVALYTEHIPLKEVIPSIEEKRLTQFFIDFYNNFPRKNIAVLGVNPHAGDNGVLGDEEKKIIKAIKNANDFFQKEIFHGPFVPDVAFTPKMRENYSIYIAMYHDQGLTPLKALYFDESINISLNLPILRTSVDHGTAFDIAYKYTANSTSYINAIKFINGELFKK